MNIAALRHLNQPSRVFCLLDVVPAQQAFNPRDPFVNAEAYVMRLPNRMMTAFEVAEFVGCHEETVRRAYLRGLLASASGDQLGRFQDPPLLATSPFHRFGVSIRARDETKRDRRIHRDEEQTLLAACLTMNTAGHKWTGPAMHDRIIAALESCCRQGEMLRMQNRNVDRTQHQILIRGVNAKDSENRRIPFDPKGPVLLRS